MPDFDWGDIQRGKEIHRAHLAALPPDERMKLIERLHAQGIAMRRPHASPVNESRGTWGVSASGAAIQLNLLGANPTFVTVVTANGNSTQAVGNTVIEHVVRRTR